MKMLRRLLIVFLGILLVILGIKASGGFRRDERNIPEPTKNPQEKFFKFAVMSDIHADWENLQKALEIVKNDSVKFIVITGDLTTLGKKSELSDGKEILDKSGLKYYIIPGNHDYWWSQRFKDEIFEEIFGKKYQSFKIDNIKFILIDNGSPELGLGEKQSEWLKREIEGCLRFYCLLFAHMPFTHPTSLHIMGEDNPKVVSEAGELVKLLVKNRVKEVFSGHLHYSSSYELDELHTTIVGAISRERNFQSPKFLEVLVKGDILDKKETFIDLDK